MASILFNSQAWRNLTNKDSDQLQTLQLRLLRRICGAPPSISTSFLFLELGVLPIKYEIHKRQISFLHHILNLDRDDPVYVAYELMKSLPGELDWYNDIQALCATYKITMDEEEVAKMSKDSFKKLVKIKVEKFALDSLKEECANQSKTKGITYDKLQMQPY